MDKKEALMAESHFERLTFRHLTLCLNAYENKEYLASAIISAVFAEALLKDICNHYQIELPTKEVELNTLIEKTKSQIRSKEEVTKDDRKYLVNLAGRCDEIRTKRNRLVHDTGVEREKLDTDVAADDMHNNVLQIVDLYLKTTMATQIRQRFEKTETSEDASADFDNFSVFISTITPHTVEQEVFLNAVCNQMSLIGIRPVKCQFDAYDKNDPMEKVRKIIQSCDAFLVIGLERSHTYLYRDKEHSRDQAEGIHRKHTSGWLHIESGMAIALKKKVFVMCHEEIYGDGIFDRGWNSYPVMEVPSPLDVKNENVQLTLRKIKEYARECSGR